MNVENPSNLFTEFLTDVRFSEVDALKIVWHGHYIRYFEDAREAFGKKYGLTYLDVDAAGYTIPIVKVECDYKAPLRYGDVLRVRCTIEPAAAAKIIFHYEVWNQTTGLLAATGKTIQVFLDKEGVLQLYAPDFFMKWKESLQLP